MRLSLGVSPDEKIFTTTDERGFLPHTPHPTPHTLHPTSPLPHFPTSPHPTPHTPHPLSSQEALN
ncbi:hypothetical protein B1L04_26985 [Microcystis aeruginosa KW]|uniref:Uncharacterized protein n=1 Tax=Microcystis aeruginosa KW TaxID=1960155 RepID=A0A1V4BQB6_MICAE|nr:hypothetical protein B1L04_26985 [Microcystis aeruginosa KW]